MCLKLNWPLSVASASTMQSSSAAVAASVDEQKRQEYAEWLKQQEKEQQMLEYDCSVKYEVKQVETPVPQELQGWSRVLSCLSLI